MVLKDFNNRRDWQPREQRLLSEFFAREYPTTPVATRVRLGSIEPELVTESLSEPERRMIRVFKRWADGLIFLPDKTIIVEAKIRLDPGVISKLEIYRRLFFETPEYKDRWTLPVELMLVFAIEDPVTIELAREKGIRCIPFRPEWVPEYLRLLTPRERRAPRVARAGGE